MDVIAALIPSLVVAGAFAAIVVVIIRKQNG